MDNPVYTLTNQHNGATLKLFHSIKAPEKRIFREHHHAEFEISLFKDGAGTYRVLDKSYEISRDAVFLFSTHEVHCITEISQPMCLINIQFEPRFIWSMENGLLSPDYLNIFFSRAHGSGNRLDFSNPNTDEIRRLMLEIEQEFINKKHDFELMINVKLLNILVLLSRSFGYSRDTDFGFNNQSLYFIDRATNYINENLTSDISLSDIAKTANMSRTYFSNLFKKLNGISPWDYITIKRIEKSIELLKSCDLTVLEIATNCGFNNTANFNRAFKKVTGKVPGDYKKSAKS